MNRQWGLVAGTLALLALLLYAPLQSTSYDDFDSISFALALDRYDLALQQPHPPGFPVYVAAGSLLRAFLGDRLLALTLLSVLSGAAGCVLVAWLGATAGNRRAGIAAGLLLTTLPGYWLTAEIALSDVPGLAFALAGVAAWWRASQRSRWLAVAAVISALSIGVRPQNTLPLALFGLFAVISLIRTEGWRRAAPVLLEAAATGGLTILLWLVPIVQSTGGLEHYLTLLRAHSAHVYGVDSLFARPVTADALRLRVDAFLGGLLGLVGGDPVLGLLTLIVAGIGSLRAAWRSAFVRLCGLWLAGGLIQVFLWNSLERPRLYLIFVPPLILLTALGWLRRPRQTGDMDGSDKHAPHNLRGQYASVGSIVLIGLSAAFAATSLPLAAVLAREKSPPLQAADWIRANAPPDQAAVVMLGSLRAAQIALPDYRLLFLGQYDAAWGGEIAARQTPYLVLMDRDDVWEAAYEKLTAPGNYVPILEQQFSRNPRAFPQHSLVRVEILVPLRSLTPDQLALPASGEIAIGAASSSKYLGAGWYRSEDIAGAAARWAQQEAVIRAALAVRTYRLTLEGTPYPAGQQVQVVVNGQPVGTLELVGVWEPRSITIPASVLATTPVTTIVLRHTRVDLPPGSDRRLAAAYRRVLIVPSDAP